MDKHLLQLGALLEALGVQLDVGSFDGRLLAQKAVYLGQRAGVDLGYRYGWYKRGPYSPSLTADYYELSTLARVGGSAIAGDEVGTAASEYHERLSTIERLLDAPRDVPLERAQWLELVASLDYLVSVCKYPPAKADEAIERRKADLVPYVEAAWAALRAADLQPAVPAAR